MAIRPVAISPRSPAPGRSGFTRSIVTSVAAAFSALSRLDMIAASIAARMMPRRPTGRSSKASVGNASSAVSSPGQSAAATSPGTIISSRFGTFRSPANSAPLRPSSRLRAASARCTKYWLNTQ